jgi:hypothetical protein
MKTYQFTLNKVKIKANSEKEAIDKFENNNCFNFDWKEIECLGEDE